MASVNKIILIGNIGRDFVQFDSACALGDAKEELRKQFDAFALLLARKFGPAYGSAEPQGAMTLKSIAKHLALALKRWREALSKFLSETKVTLQPHAACGSRMSAFFSADKVDGRNLP